MNTWGDVETELAKLRVQTEQITSARRLIRTVNERLEELTLGMEIFPVKLELDGAVYQLGYAKDIQDGLWQLCLRDPRAVLVPAATASALLVLLAVEQLVPLIDAMTDQIGAFLASLPASATAGALAPKKDTPDAIRKRVETAIEKIGQAAYFQPPKGRQFQTVPIPLDARFVEYARWIIGQIREAMKEPKQ